jgi:glutamate synthase (NADPH/NADH) small chain
MNKKNAPPLAGTNAASLTEAKSPSTSGRKTAQTPEMKTSPAPETKTPPVPEGNAPPLPEEKALPPKARRQIPRVPMPEQEPQARSRNFEEVNLGLNVLDAVTEASRCIACAKPGCVVDCPVGVKIKEIVALIRVGDFLGAAAKLREDNALPAITGRVCPQEKQCEGGCILGQKGAPVAIGNLERFVADYERQSGQLGLPANAPSTGKSVAIVGSGPAGLSAAGDLVQKGHRVRVFEALHEVGGVLVYGIPEFRLPKSIVKSEVDNLRRMGVEFETNVVVGKSVTIDELMRDEHYDAVFVATGAGLPQFLGVPGEHLNGVYSANEFLTRVNLMRAYQTDEYDEPLYDCRGKDVIVVGGGNTAMDAVRTARRLGARTATLVYRRSETEMPARAEEAKHARQEGIEFRLLTNPVEFMGDEKGRLTGARCVHMELSEPDASGRRRPVEIKGSEFLLPADVVIIGVGTTANPLVQSSTPDLKTTPRNYIVADPETLHTSKRGVFAGGDIVTGGATVILAMGAGRKAAASIHEFLTTGEW